VQGYIIVRAPRQNPTDSPRLIATAFNSAKIAFVLIAREPL
jgi:hypothetical protein